MRRRMAWLSGFFLLGIASFAALSLTRGQERPALPPTGQFPATGAVPAANKAAPRTLPAEQPGRDLSKLSPLEKQMYWNAQRGADWLYRMNGRDGRFVHGYLPALRRTLDGDNDLRQMGAAFALARAARFTGEERHAVRASQAVLLLLESTVTDANHPQVRFTSMPSTFVNRLAAAGLLVLAINELPAPKEDLLEKSEQLCNFIRKQQYGDGSLCYTDNPSDTKTAEAEGINLYPGAALYALMRSQQHRPAAWKTDLVRKALAFYQPWWRTHKNLAFVAWQTAAYAEAYLLTKEQAFADFVFEMNDWLCGLQYERLDPRQPLWVGGFMGFADGKPLEAAPRVDSASSAEAVAEACRVARLRGDEERYQRYSQTLERCLQFLSTLQYADANTQHFADWYRPMVLGAFHASHQDGNLRLDYTQHAVSALVQYLTHGLRRPS